MLYTLKDIEIAQIIPIIIVIIIIIISTVSDNAICYIDLDRHAHAHHR